MKHLKMRRKINEFLKAKARNLATFMQWVPKLGLAEGRVQFLDHREINISDNWDYKCQVKWMVRWEALTIHN